MMIASTITGWIFFLVFVVGFILAITGRHRSKLFFIIAFAVMAVATLGRQVMYLVLGGLLGGGFYGGSAYGILSILLSLLELGGFVVLLVGVRAAVSQPSDPLAAIPAGVPAPYGMPPGVPAPPPAAGPVCRTCGTPAGPGQTQCVRCGGALI